MRLFIVAYPTPQFLVTVRQIVRQLGKIKRNFQFIPYDQLHMTIKFIGDDVSMESFQQISKSFENYDFSNMQASVEFDDIQFGFPGQKYPTVIFFTVEPSISLNNLGEETNEMISGLQLSDTIRRKDRNRHTNHITVARSKRSHSKSLGRQTRGALQGLVLQKLCFKIEELSLMESILTPTGPVYKNLTRVKIS